jgi:hypothetical protein
MRSPCSTLLALARDPPDELANVSQDGLHLGAEGIFVVDLSAERPAYVRDPAPRREARDEDGRGGGDESEEDEGHEEESPRRGVAPDDEAHVVQKGDEADLAVPVADRDGCNVHVSSVALEASHLAPSPHFAQYCTSDLPLAGKRAAGDPSGEVARPSDHGPVARTHRGRHDALIARHFREQTADPSPIALLHPQDEGFAGGPNGESAAQLDVALEPGLARPRDEGPEPPREDGEQGDERQDEANRLTHLGLAST